MNIEYTGRLYEAAKLRRFAGKVYDRIVRPLRIMIYIFCVVGLAAEVLMYLRGGHLDYYLLFFFAIFVLALKFNRARYQKAFDLVTRRLMGDSDEGTIVMTDACYEFRSGGNVLRVGWRNIGSCYLFLDGGLAVLEGKIPRLLLPSLDDLGGANEEEVRAMLEKAGLRDYRHCRSYWWVLVLLVALAGGAVAQVDLMQKRAKMSASGSVECGKDDDGRFQRAWPRPWRRRHAETVRRLKAIVMPELFFYAPATMKDFVEYMNQATKDFDDPGVPLEKRGIKFVCKDSVAAKTGPEKPKPDAPLIPCPGVGATTAWDALTNVCNSVGCKFVVSQGKVELGE